MSSFGIPLSVLETTVDPSLGTIGKMFKEIFVLLLIQPLVHTLLLIALFFHSFHSTFVVDLGTSILPFL